MKSFNKTILVCVGTRPEWLKVKPVIDALQKSGSIHKLLLTRQHTDLLDLPRADYELQIPDGRNRLDEIIGFCSAGFPDEGYDGVLVQGDTASAFGCALAAFHRQKLIYHLEAGLRSYDFKNPFPEEGYRQMISRITDIHFCPTKTASVNLIEEGIGNQQLDNIHVVGNTVLDNIVDIKTSYEPQVLVTLHRRENIPIMRDWFQAINRLSREYPELRFVLPMHPNLEIQRHKEVLTHVEVVDPMPHDELINFLKDTTLIITDSGGLQEEGAFLNKRVLVCRKTTERPEGIETGHSTMCPSPDVLRERFQSILLSHRIYQPCPYGDGNSAERIAKIINE